MSKQFVLGDNTIIFEGDIEEYNNVYSRFLKEQSYYGECFFRYLVNVSTADELEKTVLDTALKYFAQLYHSFEDLYLNKGYIDFSADYLTSNDDLFHEVINPFMEPYFEFVSGIHEIKVYGKKEAINRQLSKLNRAQVVGGGFGLSGAAKGIITASAINTVTGLAYDGLNVFNKMKTDDRINDLKEELRTQSRLALYIGFEETMVNIFTAVINQLEIKVDFDSRKATAILTNVNNGKLTDAEVEQKAILEAMKLDPYNVSAYETYIKYADKSASNAFKNEPDNLETHKQILLYSDKILNGIKDIANYFGIDISAHFKCNDTEYSNRSDTITISSYNEILVRTINSKLNLINKLDGKYNDNDYNELISSYDLQYNLTAINWCIRCTMDLLDKVDSKDTVIYNHLTKTLQIFESKKSTFYNTYINTVNELFCKEASKENITLGLLSADANLRLIAARNARSYYDLYIGDLFPRNMYNEFPDAINYEPYVYLKSNCLLCSNGLYFYDDDNKLIHLNLSDIKAIKCEFRWYGADIFINSVRVCLAKKFTDDETIFKSNVLTTVYTIGDLYSVWNRSSLPEDTDANTAEEFKILFSTKQAEAKSSQPLSLKEQKEKDMDPSAKAEDEAEKTECIEQAKALDIAAAKEELGNYEKWSKMYDDRKYRDNHTYLKSFIGIAIAFALGWFGLVYLAFCFIRLKRRVKKLRKVRLIKMAEGDEYISTSTLEEMSQSWI